MTDFENRNADHLIYRPASERLAEADSILEMDDEDIRKACQNLVDILEPPKVSMFGEDPKKDLNMIIAMVIGAAFLIGVFVSAYIAFKRGL